MLSRRSSWVSGDLTVWSFSSEDFLLFNFTAQTLIFSWSISPLLSSTSTRRSATHRNGSVRMARRSFSRTPPCRRPGLRWRRLWIMVRLRISGSGNVGRVLRILRTHPFQSNCQGSLILDILRYARIKPQVLQIELHPYLTQEALVDLAKELRIAITGYSSFGPQSYIELSMDRGASSLLGHDVITSLSSQYKKSLSTHIFQRIMLTGLCQLRRRCCYAGPRSATSPWSPSRTTTRDWSRILTASPLT
jgi:hypothetical protein